MSVLFDNLIVMGNEGDRRIGKRVAEWRGRRGLSQAQLAGFVESPQGAVPQISKREISTAVLVDDGQTVVIGGVYEFSSRQDLTKVPFLGDLPLLGNLFKTTNKQSAKAELLIFVSPKVLAVTGKTAR